MTVFEFLPDRSISADEGTRGFFFVQGKGMASGRASGHKIYLTEPDYISTPYKNGTKQKAEEVEGAQCFSGISMTHFPSFYITDMHKVTSII